VSLLLAFAPAAFVAAWPSWQPPWAIVGWWAIGTLGLIGLSNGAHEAVHGHFLYMRRVDRWIGRLLHGCLLLNFDVHRRYHLMHHLDTGGEHDTEGVFGFETLPSLSRYGAQLLRWAAPPSPLHVLNWRVGARAMIGSHDGLAGQITRGDAVAGFVVPGAHAALLVAWIVVDPVSAVLAWAVPQLVLFPLYAYVTALPEHFGLAANPPSERTRNVRTWGPLQFLLWNFNLHAAHHRSPHLHFSALPEMARRGHAPASAGYVRFHLDVLQRLRSQDAAVSTELLGVRA
jgi:fatty acid desaturase